MSLNWEIYTVYYTVHFKDIVVFTYEEDDDVRVGIN